VSSTLKPLQERDQRSRGRRPGRFRQRNVYLEKYLENPRHMRSGLADGHKNVVHLGERDLLHVSDGTRRSWRKPRHRAYVEQRAA